MSAFNMHNFKNITYNKYLQILIYLNIIGAINYNKKGAGCQFDSPRLLICQ